MAPALIAKPPVVTDSVGPRRDRAELCSLIEEHVARSVGALRFDRYFRSAARLALDEDGLTVAVSSAFYASWLEGNFSAPLRESAREVSGDPTLTVRWRVAPEQLGAAKGGVRPGGSSPTHTDRLTSDAGATPPAPALARRRDRRERSSKITNASQTLESFVVGPANKLAFGAARAMVSQDRDPGFRTMFVHGDCGVGKTHLLQGIVHAEREQSPSSRVRYTSAEAFTNAYIRAVRAGELDSFRADYRRLDLLCIDDVHFIAGKTGTQNEFLHTFDALDLARGRVTLASDAHPADITRLNHRLVSRCLAGMVVRIDWPDASIRREIARRRAAQRGLRLSDDALVALAAESIGSVRDLEGVLARVEALVRLLPNLGSSADDVPAAIVRKAIEPGRSARPTRPVRLETILQVVLDELRVEADDVRGRGRHGRVVLARSLIAHLSRKLTTHSFPEIARALGRHNHSTVVTACQRVERRLGEGAYCHELRGESEMTLSELCGRLSRQILERTSALGR